MDRRTVLRNAGAAVLTATTAALAGCGGSGNGDGDGGDGGDDGGSNGGDGGDGSDGGDGAGGTTADGGGDGGSDGGDGGGTTAPESTPTQTTTCRTASGEPTGEVSENTISGIDVTDFSARRGSDRFVVAVTLENVGEATTTMEYNIDVTTFDPDGNRLNQGFTTVQRSYPDDYGPGESQTFEVDPQVDCPSAVASYEIAVNCAATPNSGDYCN